MSGDYVELRAGMLTIIGRMEASGEAGDAGILREFLAHEDLRRSAVILAWDRKHPGYGGAKVMATTSATPTSLTINLQDDAGNKSAVMIECDRGLASIRAYMPEPREDDAPDDGIRRMIESPVLGVIFGADKSAVYLGDNRDRVFELVCDQNEVGPIEDTGYDDYDEESAFARLRIGADVPPAPAEDMPFDLDVRGHHPENFSPNN